MFYHLPFHTCIERVQRLEEHASHCKKKAKADVFRPHRNSSFEVALVDLNFQYAMDFNFISSPSVKLLLE